jgi:hypothetical protein
MGENYAVLCNWLWRRERKKYPTLLLHFIVKINILYNVLFHFNQWHGNISFCLQQSAVKITLMSIHIPIKHLHSTLILHLKQNCEFREKYSNFNYSNTEDPMLSSVGE